MAGGGRGVAGGGGRWRGGGVRPRRGGGAVVSFTCRRGRQRRRAPTANPDPASPAGGERKRWEGAAGERGSGAWRAVRAGRVGVSGRQRGGRGDFMAAGLSGGEVVGGGGRGWGGVRARGVGGRAVGEAASRLGTRWGNRGESAWEAWLWTRRGKRRRGRYWRWGGGEVGGRGGVFSRGGKGGGWGGRGPLEGGEGGFGWGGGGGRTLRGLSRGVEGGGRWRRGGGGAVPGRAPGPLAEGRGRETWRAGFGNASGGV